VLHIFEVMGSKLNREADIVSEISRGFPPDKCKDSKKYIRVHIHIYIKNHPRFPKTARSKKK
jgi:hypothetical protein